MENNDTMGGRYVHVHGTDIFHPFPSDNEELPYQWQIDEDMGEASIHFKIVAGLLSVLEHFLRARADVFLSCNMNLYFVETNLEKWVAPDVMIAFGVASHERVSYRLWEEGVTPQIVFEVASKRTWKDDIGLKEEIYSDMGVEEYYLLDPQFDFLPAPLLAYHRQTDRLIGVPVKENRVLSPRLGLEIVHDDDGFRLFNPATNSFLLTLSEAESELAAARAEIEGLRSGR